MMLPRLLIVILVALPLCLVGCKKKDPNTASGPTPGAAAPAPGVAKPAPGADPASLAPKPPGPGQVAPEPNDEPPPKPDPEDVKNRPKKAWELPGPDPKSGAPWVITPAEVTKMYKLGMPAAKLREKVLHALEDGHIKEPMKATKAEQKQMIEAGVSKNMVHFLMNLPVD